MHLKFSSDITLKSFLFKLNPLLSGFLSFCLIATSSVTDSTSSLYSVFAFAQVAAGFIGCVFAFTQRHKLTDLDANDRFGITAIILLIMVVLILNHFVLKSVIFLSSFYATFMLNMILSVCVISGIFSGYGLRVIYLSLIPGFALLMRQVLELKDMNVDTYYNVSIITSTILVIFS